MDYFENIFICYSPVHITASFSLTKERSLVILPKKYSSILKYLPTKNVKLRLCFISTFTDEDYKKLFALLFNLISFSKRKYKCKNLFIPNAAHHGIRVISKSIEFEFLNYLDEGSTVLSLIREKNITFKSNQLSKFLLGLLGIKVGDNFLDEKFHKHYVFYPKILRKLGLIKNITGIPQLELTSKEKNCLKQKIYLNHSRESILFLTSPLSENGWVEYKNQEVYLIQKILNEIKKESINFCIYLKPHYREKISKYKKLLRKESFYFLPNDIPSQILSSLLKPTLILGFHSSALFEYQSANKVISLSKLIKTPQCRSLSNGLKLYQSYFKELKMVEYIDEIFDYM